MINWVINEEVVKKKQFWFKTTKPTSHPLSKNKSTNTITTSAKYVDISWARSDMSQQHCFNLLSFSISIVYWWLDWASSTGCISDFFFSLRIACLGITSNRKLPPFHIEAETFSIWKTTCNSYDKNMGTVRAMVATVNMPWRKMYISMRFWSPSNPLRRHHMLFAFWAFFESSLRNNQNQYNERWREDLFCQYT